MKFLNFLASTPLGEFVLQNMSFTQFAGAILLTIVGVVALVRDAYIWCRANGFSLNFKFILRKMTGEGLSWD